MIVDSAQGKRSPSYLSNVRYLVKDYQLTNIQSDSPLSSLAGAPRPFFT